MPPSPSWGCSPGREFRAANHKRGRSLDGGLLLREKDDDLALFNDMQMREKDNFLLQSSDDLDDSLSMRLRYFSTSKLGILIPVRGESSDLLDGDGDKKDYDWLLTPPGSPLFPSLDDETPSVNLSRRGRPRSQPVTITRSATMEKSYRTSRSSASPHRLSPSPRSGNSISQSRGRPSSASHSSPTPTLRPKTPSRSPSNPPNKPSTPTPRSSTPTLRRTNTGLSGTSVSSGRSGSSPAKASRGNSPSSKLQAWQSGIPGFSSEAPPNLRTSLSDRPASYVRGSSPASRNGRGSSPASRDGMDSSSKSGRQSMSPTASRSASSSYSHDRDRFSSQSKGSVASSGDDDIDSLQSVSVSVSTRSSARKVGVFPNSRTPTFSKKLSRTPSSSSAPKRSFDSALRQMDKKSPQNMFRPLLSSVPSTTFFLGKANSSHQPTISRNSSVATSSNASSEQGGSGAHNTVGSDPCQDDNTEWGKALNSDPQTEVFNSDKVDGMNEDVGHEIHDGTPNLGRCEFEGTTSEVRPGESENFSSHNAAAAIPASASGSLYIEDFDCHDNVASCSMCGRKFCIMESTEESDGICPDCCKKDVCLPLTTTVIPAVVTQPTEIHSQMNLEENKAFDDLEPEVGVPELTELTTRGEALLVEDVINVEQGQSCLLDSSHVRSMVEESKQHFLNQQVVGQAMVSSNHLDSVSADQQLHYNAHPSLNIDVSEGAGIPILLKRSSSSKSHVAHGRAFSATNIPYDDLTYARDSVNKMRSSIGHCSVSATSSLDLSSSKQEVHVQRQLSGRKANMENSGHDLITKHNRCGSSFSEISDHSCQASVLPRSTIEKKFDVSAGNVEYKALEETLLFTEDQGKDTEVDDTHSSFIRTTVTEGERLGSTESCRKMDSSASESSHTPSIRLEDTSVATFTDDACCISSENAEGFPCKTRSISDIGEPIMTPESSIEEDAMLNSCVCGIDVTEDHTHSLLVTVSEELENGHESIPGSQIGSPNSKCSMDELTKPSVPMTSEEEESRVTVGCQGHEARSISMKEATDTLLFCGSIVHDLAYQAATIAMEKENSIPLKGARPTLLGKTSSDRKESRGRTISKRPSESQKARQRRVEVDGKILSTKTDTNIKDNEYESMKHSSVVPNKVDSLRPPKLESKCNCTVM
ncbi:hypothetical protein BVC80_1837g389 [Macleaya cordata]|uniref:Uncharacterized protein n=1 Tax=Macleaya cordata TaxID=56857 RepID=A0A200R4E9_MACCD|nr:hypothetical protein BVC80_1837g389 [Macleaya cordata]